jgi:hypothetical protein
MEVMRILRKDSPFGSPLSSLLRRAGRYWMRITTKGEAPAALPRMLTSEKVDLGL